MTFHTLRTFLFGTLRGRLVLSVAIIHAIMMTLFVVDLTIRQRTMLLENQTEAAIATSNSLATSAAEWIAADDLSGLQELVEAQRRYPEMSFVILTDESGAILAASDTSKIGLYLLDLPEKPEQIVLGRSAALVDVAVPAMLNDRHVGWARVGLGQEAAAEKLTGITNAGILYAFAAIFIGSFIAWNMGTRITRRLYVVQDLIGKVKKGDRTARAIVTGTDEAASIAHEFNSMLDALDERDEALRKSEAQYRIVADNTQDWEFWLGSDGNFRYCSPSSLQLTGYTAAEFLADSNLIYHVVHPEDRPIFERHRQQAEQGRTSEEIEFRIQHADGTIRWVSHLCSPLHDEKGQFQGTRGANRDITDRKQAEEALRKSAEEIQDLYDHAPCGYHSLDSEGLIIRINDTELQWLGYTRDEVVGKMKFTDLITEKGLQTFQEKFPLFKRQGWIKDLEFELICRDGTHLNVLLSGTAIYDEAGNYLMSRTTIFDISERKQAEDALHASENRFRVLSENAFVGIYIIQDGCLSYVNSTMAKIFGYTPEELTGAQPALVIHPDDQALVSENIRRRIVGEIETIHYEFRGRCKDGGIKNIEVLGGRIDFGGKTAIIGNLMDITERRRAENALHERELHSQSLLRISKKLEQAQTYAEVLEACRSEVREMVGYQNLWVYLLSEDKKYFKSLIAGGDLSDTVMSEEGTATLTIQGDRMLEEIAAAKGIVIIEDAQQDERVNKEVVTRLGNRTIINVPIFLFDRHLGSVGMGTFGEEGVRIPSELEREYLMSMASHLAVSLDRIHLLNRLKQMEQEYRTLVENIPDLIVRYDKELRRIYVNPAWEKASGLSASEVVNVPPSQIPKVPSPINIEYANKLRQALETGKVQTIEFTWVNAHGKTLFLEYVIVPEHDTLENIRGVLSVGRDITERKHAEEALRESEAKLGEAARIAHVGYWDRDYVADTIILSDEACQIFGISSQYRFFNLAEWHEQWVKLIHPEDQPKVMRVLKEALAGGPPYKADYRVLHPDGSIRHIHSYANLTRDESGNPVRMFGTMIDITERKQMEEALAAREREFRTLAENSPDNIARYDVNCQTIYVNPALEKTLGRPASEMLGTFPGQASFIAEGKEYQDKINEVLETGKVAELDIVLPDTGEGKHYHNIRFVAERDADGTIMGILAIGRDFTERKQIEDTLKKNNALLERIFSSTEFLIAYLDVDFNFIRVNRAYAKADEHDPEFFIGKNHFDLYPNMENETIFRQVIESGETYTAYAKPFEYPENPERGVSYWNWTLQPLKEADGHVSGLVFSLVDVTEREKALLAQHEIDARYRTLIEQASDGIFVADPQGNYVDVNPSGCAMLGYTREEILKLNMRDLASTKTRKEQPLRFNELQSGKSIISERTLTTKSEDLLPVEISGKMLENGQFLGIVRDITDRKRHEMEHQAIINVSAALRQAITRTETLDVILKQLEKLFETDGVVLVMPNPQNHGLVDEMGCGPVGERMKGVVIPPGKGVCNWVIANKKPYLNNHAEDDPLFYRPDLLGSSNCIAAAPLITQEQAIGALWIARRKTFTEHDLHLLTAITDIAASAIHRAVLHEQIEQQVRHLLALHEIDIAITANFNLDVTLNIILKHVKDELNVDAASLLLVNPSTHALDYRYGVGFKTRNIERSSVKLGEGLAGRAALEYKTASWLDLRRVDDKFSRSSLLAEEEFISYYATPLVVKGQVKGVLEVFNRNPLQAEQDWLGYFETLATQTAIAIENASLLENLQKSNRDLLFAYDATIEGWSHALDLRDKETEGHSQRVTEMALELAEKIGMTEAERADLRRGALLHDIGKMGVPDAILHKAGKLTEKEWKVMRQHPIFAYQMLSPITYLKRALDICYYHHEKWDGTGYPHRLKGEEIPLAARVFAIVDVFDALTSDRPYRKAWTHEEAFRYVEEQAGKHFDPQIVKVFLENKSL